MNEFESFWMLFAANGSAPTRRHDSLASAEGEAARIAAKQNCQVFILKTVQACSPVPNVQWLKSADKYPSYPSDPTIGRQTP